MTLRHAAAALPFALLALGSAHAEAANYAIDPSHTFVTWEAKHFGTSTFRGRFDKTEGTVTLDPAAKTGKIDITISLASISSGVAPLDTHLKSKDFFNVDVHPTAKFTADKLTFSGEKVTGATGTLTMNGKSAAVTLTGTGFGCYQNPMTKKQTCGGDFQTSIKRSQWGVSYGVPDAVADEVHLLIQVEAAKQ